MKVGSLTDVGLKRSHNEDSLLAASFMLGGGELQLKASLFVVSDGMGGAASGEVASRLTIDLVAKRVFGGLLEAHLDRDRGVVNTGRLVRDAVETANRKVWYSARASHEHAGMGATVTVGLVVEGLLTLAHVGDSRCYLFRRGELRQLTEDHSFVNELLREGRITVQEAARHPRRNVITRAIGSREHVLVDVRTDELEAGDLLLLCSDGLSGMVPDDELQAHLGRLVGAPVAARDLGATCKTLIDLANAAGGKDNITAVVAGVEHHDVPARRVRPLLLRPEVTVSWETALAEGLEDRSYSNVTVVPSPAPDLRE